jgi:pyridoxamine 5'-phosphate oxidase family protein
MTEPVAFTDAQLAYLATQRLARLATIRPDGSPQNSPVGFRYNAGLGTIDIGGMNMAASKKFRNVRLNGLVSLVIDDIASSNPWRVRCCEIRGRAEALTDPVAPAIGGPIIRIHPTRIVSWGL